MHPGNIGFIYGLPLRSADFSGFSGNQDSLKPKFSPLTQVYFLRDIILLPTLKLGNIPCSFFPQSGAGWSCVSTPHIHVLA